MSDFRIYVACLASYNNGVLHGRWIDVEGKDADDIQEEVNAILRESRFPNVTVEFEGKEVPSAEEWAIHDHEGFGNMIGEYTSFEDVAKIAEGLSGDHALAFRWLVEDRSMDPDDAADKAEEVSIFQDKDAWSEEDLLASYAQELADDCYSEEIENLPNLFKYHIDWKGVGRDLRIGGDVDYCQIGDERFLVTNAAEF